jgi:hypothetical protein
MASSNYMAGRKQYGRPQAMLWSDTPGTISNGTYVPSGYEKRSDSTGLTSTDLADSFLILSDHNRSEISITNERIEQRKRMINGTMRSYHIADKVSMTVSWNMLPSRAYGTLPNFNQSTGLSTYDDSTPNRNAEGTIYTPATQYTVDGGAGGVELLDWYENHTGPFWVFLSYDKHNNFGNNAGAYAHLQQYSQIVHMYISGFDYSIVKRGGTNMDLWNVSVSLEEV